MEPASSCRCEYLASRAGTARTGGESRVVSEPPVGIEPTTFSLRDKMPGSTRLHSSPLACGYALNERCYDASVLQQLQPNCTTRVVRRTRSCCCCGCSGGCPDPSVIPPRVGLLEHRICRSTDVPGAGLLRVRRWRCRCVASGEGGRASTRGTCRRQDAPTSPVYSRREGDWFGFGIGQNRPLSCPSVPDYLQHIPVLDDLPIRVQTEMSMPPAGPWWQQLEDEPKARWTTEVPASGAGR